MITKEIALSLRHGQTLYHFTARNADKTPLRCRVNGACKTRKTRSNEYSLPVKHGLKNCFYITERSGGDWCETEAEAIARGDAMRPTTVEV